MNQPRPTIATDAQIRDLSNTIALQADALAQGKIDSAALYAHVRRMHDNTDTLKAWTEDRQYIAPSPNRREAEEAVAEVESNHCCPYCGRLRAQGHTAECGRPFSNNALARSAALVAQMEIEDLDRQRR